METEICSKKKTDSDDIIMVSDSQYGYIYSIFVTNITRR